MTFPPYSRFALIFRKRFAILLALALCACTSVNEALYPTPKSEEGMSEAREKKREKLISSQFEWAVQYYEAGQYQEAVTQFIRLRALGPELPGYELIPYYLGMSYFRLSLFPESAAELERYLKGTPSSLESQEARIALLSVYEKQKEWDKVLGLAAETDRLTLFQDKRAFLKLVWAHALWEKGEIKGARAVLKDAAPYLDGYGSQREEGVELDRDLWGRYYFTGFLLSEEDCKTQPRQAGKKRLYQAWLESTVDCYRHRLDQVAKDLLESSWATPALEQLDKSLGAFGLSIQDYMTKEKKQLATRRKLEALSRENLYRLLSKVDETIKIFKNQGVKESSLNSIRKHIDLLIVSLARPS